MADKDWKEMMMLYGGGGRMEHFGEVYGSFRDCPETNDGWQCPEMFVLRTYVEPKE
jgi:hypothetical protein